MGINDRIRKHNAKITAVSGGTANQPQPVAAVTTMKRIARVVFTVIIGTIALVTLVVILTPTGQGGDPVHHKQQAHRPKLKLTASEQFALQGVDAGMGKALQAAMSSDGLYEGRTSAEWCSLAGDALNTVLFPNSGSFEHQNTPTKRGERLSRENGTIKSFYENCM
jgi:hypothetical protein